MPLIGSLNFGLQVSQSGLHPLNVFFVISTPHIPHFPKSVIPVCMAHGAHAYRYADRLISGQENEREHVSAI